MQRNSRDKNLNKGKTVFQKKGKEIPFRTSTQTTFEDLVKQAGLEWENPRANFDNFPDPDYDGECQDSWLGQLFAYQGEILTFFGRNRIITDALITKELAAEMLEKRNLLLPTLRQLLAFGTICQNDQPNTRVVAIGQSIGHPSTGEPMYPYLGFEVIPETRKKEPVRFLGLTRADGPEQTFSLRRHHLFLGVERN